MIEYAYFSIFFFFKFAKEFLIKIILQSNFKYSFCPTHSSVIELNEKISLFLNEVSLLLNLSSLNLYKKKKEKLELG
jgi:hypothetical protein